MLRRKFWNTKTPGGFIIEIEHIVKKKNLQQVALNRTKPFTKEVTVMSLENLPTHSKIFFFSFLLISK